MTRRVRAAAAMILMTALLQIPYEGAAQSEGIKVHGAWTVEVRAPDGRLVSHHEFQNATSSNGRSLLLELLSGQRIGTWAIELDVPDFFTDNHCYDGSSSPGSTCMIVAPETPETGGQYHKTLTRLNSGTAFELKGTMTAHRDFLISHVRTRARVCPATQECSAAVTGLGTFTEKSLPSYIDVKREQIVQVKVLISFQ